MTQTRERDASIDKLERIVDGAERILHETGDRILTSQMRSELRKEQTKAMELLPKLRKSEFEIAVIGLDKAGKSTFANALIGARILPTGEARCTCATTCIRAGEADEAQVTFYTQAEFDREFREKLEILRIPQARSYSLDNLSLDAYEKAFDSLDESTKKKYSGSLHQDIVQTLRNRDSLRRYIGSSPRHFTSRQVETDDFRAFITQPGRAMAVREVVIWSTRLKQLPNAILYDVPGFNAPTASRAEQTVRRLTSADIIVLVAKADDPSLTSEPLGIFENPDLDGGQLARKLFVFENKADRAQNLHLNEEVARKEWISNRRVLPPGSEDHIVFGSAAAYLGDLSSMEEQVWEDKGIPDGIEDLRLRLLDFYEAERMDILRHRADQVEAAVTDIFEDLMRQDEDAQAPDYTLEYSKLALDLHKDVRWTVSDELRALREDILKKAHAEHALASSITDAIASLVTPERYDFRQEEIDRAHREIDGIGLAQAPGKLDGRLREQRFRAMYSDFTSEVLTRTSALHKTICDRVLATFLSALHISKGTPGYRRMVSEIEDMCGLDRDDDTRYYQSLIERYGRDLFELQIKSTQGADRLIRFNQDPSTFRSLAVFYDMESGKGAQPMWKILLYPEYAVREQGGAPRPAPEPEPESIPQDTGEDRAMQLAILMDRFTELTGVPIGPQDADSAVLTDLLGRLLALQGPDEAQRSLERTYTPQFLDDIMNQPGAQHRLGARIALEEIVSEVQQRAGSSKPAPAPKREPQQGSRGQRRETPARRERQGQQHAGEPQDIPDIYEYQRAVAKRRGNYTYDDVREEFHNDVVSLRVVLEKALVPAVDVDKAFSARESLLIEDAIRTLDSDAFQRFIVRNTGVIEHEKLDQVKRQAALHQQDMQALSRLKQIVLDMGTIADDL